MDAMHLGLNKSPLYEQVADRLEGLILADYTSGERLPSEQALAEQTGVSRTIIREAMKLLKERGLIDSKTGSGAFVTKPEAQNISNVMARIIQIEKIDPDSIYEIREVLECAAVRLAVRRATEEDISEMTKTLDALRDRGLDAQTRRNLDFHFHYLIARASRNPLLAILVESMSNVFKDVIRT
ncbi:MAG: GntR family transcriptional regulator, partial [Clostridia bacterium]|nr:GntR family transcriptional regulator [Clostridia bacterium]